MARSLLCECLQTAVRRLVMGVGGGGEGKSEQSLGAVLVFSIYRSKVVSGDVKCYTTRNNYPIYGLNISHTGSHDSYARPLFYPYIPSFDGLKMPH